jgi:hypothetical protein
MTNPRVAACLFCDDIRHEVGNKISLVGVYGGDMIFPMAPPTLLPKFCAMVMVISDVDDRVTQASIRIVIPSIGPEGHETLKIEIPQTGPVVNADGAIKITFRTFVQLGPIPLTKEGFIEVWVDTGREEMRAGRLRISFTGAPSDETSVVSG